MSQGRILSVLIPAVGGQGGGVLLDWIVSAALADGYPVHGTSIPGVAQRTGSTTYYVELFTERVGPDEVPNFSLYPVPGALDILLAAEFLEVGRMVELGFPSPARTTIIASTHRLYSIHEKIATGRGIYPREQLQAAARAFSRSLYAFDALALAREHATEANAVLLGALAGSGALPLTAAAYRTAIEQKGVQVEANLRGLDVGIEAARRIGDGAAAAPASGSGPTPVDGAPAAPSRSAEATGAAVDPALGRRIQGFPDALRPTLVQGVARLVDYQDTAYAARYLDRLGPLLRFGREDLLLAVARSLAVWMTYEDAVRVAQLKTRASRFARIRREARAERAEIVVTDFLKPDLDEILAVLPHRLVAPVARWAEHRWPGRRPTLGQHVRTTTVSGFLRVWLLGLLRPLRPVSHRAHEEHGRMERWLDAVIRCASLDADLGRELARAPQVLKGYGEVRRRMIARFEDLLARVVRAAELEAAAGAGFEASRTLAARYRELILQGPSGELEAATLAASVVARLEAADRRAALAALGAG